MSKTNELGFVYDETPAERRERIIENILVAQAMMQEIPDKHIIESLKDWSELCVTPEQKAHDEACDPATPEDLRSFKCGSAACFGGWCAVHPHFRAQGVRTQLEVAEDQGIAASGAPVVLTSENTMFSPWYVARYLFDDFDAFDTFGANNADFADPQDSESELLNERAAINARLQAALARQIEDMEREDQTDN